MFRKHGTPNSLSSTNGCGHCGCGSNRREVYALLIWGHCRQSDSLWTIRFHTQSIVLFDELCVSHVTRGNISYWDSLPGEPSDWSVWLCLPFPEASTFPWTGSSLQHDLWRERNQFWWLLFIISEVTFKNCFPLRKDRILQQLIRKIKPFPSHGFVACVVFNQARFTACEKSDVFSIQYRKAVGDGITLQLLHIWVMLIALLFCPLVNREINVLLVGAKVQVWPPTLNTRAC